MRGWRAFGAATAAIVAGFALLAGLLSFLAPDVAYQIRNRAGEVLSGNANRKFRIATGARTGSGSRVAAALNKYLAAREGYELELVVTSSPGNVATLLDPGQHIDLAFVSSADDDAVKTGEVYALAALGTQYFFVMVPNDSPVREFRDVAGPFDPGVREPGQPPTFGERVLDYYGFLAAVDGSAPRASIA